MGLVIGRTYRLLTIIAVANVKLKLQTLAAFAVVRAETHPGKEKVSPKILTLTHSCSWRSTYRLCQLALE